MARTDRRHFLALGSAAVCAAAVPRWRASLDEIRGPNPTFSIIPIVGDGKWIWTEPPAGEPGYLEPRSFSLDVGIEIEGRGTARRIRATTPVPIQHPEQTIDDYHLEIKGCEAALRQLGTAGQLVLAAPGVARGQKISAIAHFMLTLRKDYRGFDQEQFPVSQSNAGKQFGKYLGDSPGIQTRDRRVRQLSAEIAHEVEHPWDQAQAIYRWVWDHIEPRLGDYTSVTAALENRVGDCEERAAVFVAACRAQGIPARLVWVPNHNWAEFHLTDHEGRGHWIPCHTAAYSWFGWTGVHELVLQKGDLIKVPEKRRAERLLTDWLQWQGTRPEVRFFAELKPVPVAEGDTGPGARVKSAGGRWRPTDDHPLNRYFRDGPQAGNATG